MKHQSNRCQNMFPNNIKIELLKFSLLILFLQCILFILFVAFGTYTAMADASSPGNSISPVFGGFNHNRYNIIARFQSMFQDIHTMVFVGFGFLMVFLKKYGYSAVGFNFFLAAITLQWSILCQGFFELNDNYKIEIGLISLYKADIATAAVLISMGAVLGRTSHIQLTVMGILEIVTYCLNKALNDKYFKAVDVGGSVLVHAFGAYFGLGVSYILRKKQKIFNTDDRNENAQEASYVSNILAMIGTIFLWTFWPSFNAVDLENDKAHRAIVNTYLSLASSCVIAFAASQLSSDDHKFDMVHVQNSTLAGGVAIGACTHLMLQPFGAILIGMLAGGLSVYGYRNISAVLERKLNVKDTCGVHNLHGLPGIFGGITAVLLAGTASEEQYGKTLYEVYPARASSVITHDPEYIPLEAGDDRTAAQQAGFQMLLIIVTILMALVFGSIAGLVMNLKIWNDISSESFYDDSVFWKLPEGIDDIDTHRPFKWRIREKWRNNNNNNNNNSIVNSYNI